MRSYLHWHGLSNLDSLVSGIGWGIAVTLLLLVFFRTRPRIAAAIGWLHWLIPVAGLTVAFLVLDWLPGGENRTWTLYGACLGAAPLLIVLLHRYERRLISPMLGWTLLALRLSVVAIIFLMLLQPVRISETDRERTGRILLAFDVSESMETADTHATAAEKLRWARALGMIGNAAINERLDRWEAAFEAGEEPEWVAPGEFSDPVRAGQQARARRENLERVFAELEKIPRREIARRLFLAGERPIPEKLNDLGLLETILFAGESVSVDPRELDPLLARPPERLFYDETNLALPLSGAGGARSDVPVAGIVLVTDGRHNTRGSEERLLSQVSSAATPVYPVLIGTREKPRDLAIARIDAPRQPVSQNDHPLVRAQLRTSGFEGEQITVVLEPAPGQPGEVQSQTIHVAGPTAEVSFKLDASQLGRFQYHVRTSVLPDETRDDNNTRSFFLTVVDDQADVLLIDGEARWEFRFLDNALKRDEHVNVQEVLFRQPYMGVLPETFFPRTLSVPTRVEPSLASPFLPYDVVIVGDVGTHQMPRGGWAWLDHFVREEGGTLVLLAGKHHMPLSYLRDPVVEGLLPVENLRILNQTGRLERRAPAERGFHLTLTPDGEDEAFLQLADSREMNPQLWASLPGHTWGLVGTTKGEATTLASVIPAGTEPTLETERNNAIIARQQVGFGQVLWIGVDSTWRWRHRVGDLHHHRFWGQLVRWGARFKALSKNEFVAFGPELPTVETGADALIRAAFSRQFLERFSALQPRAIISRLDDPQHTPVMTLDLRGVEGRPLDFEGNAAGLRPGDYRIRLDAENGDLGPEPIVAELQVLESPTSELSDLSANDELLASLAESTGGRLFRPEDVDELPGVFRDVSESTTLRREVSLWDHWPILLVFFGLLTGEWVLRKLNGLP